MHTSFLLLGFGGITHLVTYRRVYLPFFLLTLGLLCRIIKQLRLHFFGLFSKTVKKLRLSQAQAKKLVKKLRLSRVLIISLSSFSGSEKLLDTTLIDVMWAKQAP